MATDFSKPQRQSAVGIIIMAGHTLQKYVRAFALPLIIAIVKFDKDFLTYFGVGLIAFVVYIACFSYLNYRRFTFYLDEDKQEFIVNKGIFNRTQLTIQLDKIQQVNINQNFLQKIIGVYGLKIDTAGSASQEVSIKAIDEEVANSLREHLLNGKSDLTDNQNAISANQQTVPFLRVGLLTLLKVGLTSNYGSSIALLLAFLYPLFHNAKEFLRAMNMDEGQVENAVKSAFTFFSLGIVVIVMLMVILMINVIRTIVKYFNFEISKHQHSLLISAGLFARKNTLLSPDKVQITSYSQNYFQKKFNFLNLNLKQAHSGKAQNAKDLKQTNLEVPGCNPEEKDQILKMILGDLPESAQTFIPNFRFLNLPIFFRVFLPIGIFFILWANIPEMKPYYPITIVYAVIAIVMIFISYRRHRLMINQQLIIKKSGIWDIRFEHIFPHKIQAITTFQYPWHKSVDVGHVDLHTAAGIIHFKYGNYTEIKQLVNYWLYQIESGSEEWM